MIIIPFAFEFPGKALPRTTKGSLQVYRQQIVASVKTWSEDTFTTKNLSKLSGNFHLELYINSNAEITTKHNICFY